jgi:AraC-like DNA-binding protein
LIDPLAEVVTLLQPSARFSKVVSGAGAWRVRRPEAAQPSYCVILDGSCRLAVDGHEPIDLQEGDFVLIPLTSYGSTMSSLQATTSEDFDAAPIALSNGEFRFGTQNGPPDVRFLVGHCVFGSPDAALLVSLLPQLVHVRGERRLATLMQLVVEESRELRPARDVILARLLEVLLIEALRSTAGTAASPGLLRGLADGRLAAAIRRMHESPTRAWTVAQLAKEASLSRSAFFERFSRAVGVAPMEYLLAWRMALAKNLLRREVGGVSEIAKRVGYSSASTFSVAFTRHVGLPPSRYAREQKESRHT